MTLNIIANSELTLSHTSGSPISGGAFTVTSTADAKVKSGGQGVHVSPLTFTFKGGNADGFLAGSVAGGGSMSATATKTKAGGALVMREGDSVTMACVGTIDPPPPSPPLTAPVSGGVEISAAGQTKAKAQ
jgi:hypothetical protein